MTRQHRDGKCEEIIFNEELEGKENKILHFWLFIENLIHANNVYRSNVIISCLSSKFVQIE